MQPLVDLRLGDCLNIMPDIPDKSVDLILCDPPYGTTSIKWDRPLPFEPMWEQYERIIKDNAAILLFSSQPFTTDLIASNRKLFRYEIIWKKSMKSGWLNAKKMPLRAHENIVVFYKKLPKYSPRMVPSRERPRIRRGGKDIRSAQYREYIDIDRFDSGLRFPTDVIEFGNWNGAGIGKGATKHPTQKPINLLEYLILTYTEPGDVVLDNCMGSGTTGVACVNTERNFIGIEIDPKYFSISENRIKAAKTQPKMLIETHHGTFGLAKGLEDE